MTTTRKYTLKGALIAAGISAVLMIALYLSLYVQSWIGALLAYPVAPFTVSLLAIDAPSSVTAAQIALSLSIGIAVTLIIYSLFGALIGFLYSKIKTRNGKILLIVACCVLALLFLTAPTIVVY